MYVTSVELTKDDLLINGQPFPWYIANVSDAVTVEAPKGEDDIERHLVVRVLFHADEATVTGL